MNQFKNFSVGELFRPVRGKSKYTRHYADAHPGEYPVYSASLAGPMCCIDTYDYDGIYLTWTTNGYGGRVQVLKGRFSINGDRGVLLPLHDTWDGSGLYYVRQVLEPLLREQAVGRIVDGRKNEYTKVSPELVSSTTVRLPVTEVGQFDLESMSRCAGRIKRIGEVQSSISDYLDQIKRAEVVIDCGDQVATLSLGDTRYFKISIGDRVLKSDCRADGVPVYSANVETVFGYVEKSNLLNFDQDSLIWGIDWLFNWNRIPKGTIFATTDHCGRVLLQSELLDPEYVFYYLRATRLEYEFDRVFRSSLDNVSRLVTVKVPVDGDGNFDLHKQRAVAKKYRDVDSLRTEAVTALDMVAGVSVEFDL